jgi:G3E family GTPase
MAVATFDTLKFANTLKAAGVPDKQAEAQAVAFAEVIQLNFKELVTKEDLKQELAAVEQRVNSRIDKLEAQLRGELVLIKWMFGATFTGVLATLGLVGRLLITLPK